MITAIAKDTVEDYYERKSGNTANFDEGLDVTFVLDQKLTLSLGHYYKRVVESIVKQVCSYYFL